MKTAIAGTGYVGLSLAVLLSQHNELTAVDIIPEKVRMINDRISPIQDNEIESFFCGKQIKFNRYYGCKKRKIKSASCNIVRCGATEIRMFGGPNLKQHRNDGKTGLYLRNWMI